MGITITKTSDAVHRRVTALIYGPPGIGKTSLVKTLPISDDSKVLYVGADPGQLVLRGRHFPCVHLSGDKPKSDLGELFKECSTPNKYEWVVIDGLDELGELVTRQCLSEIKHGLQAYGAMKEFMVRFVTGMRDIQTTNVIFITHINSEKDDVGRTSFRPSFPGNALTERLPDMFDLVGCMRLIPDKDGKNRRLIQFSQVPDERYICKDRSGALLDYEEPNLGDIFKKIHGAGMGVAEEAKPKSVKDVLAAVGDKLR